MVFRHLYYTIFFKFCGHVLAPFYIFFIIFITFKKLLFLSSARQYNTAWFCDCTRSFYLFFDCQSDFFLFTNAAMIPPVSTPAAVSSNTGN